MDSIISVSDQDSVVDLRSLSRAVKATLKSQALDKTVKACHLKVSRRQYEGPKGMKVLVKEFSDSIASSEASTLLPVPEREPMMPVPEDFLMYDMRHTKSMPDMGSMSTVHPVFPMRSSEHVAADMGLVKDVMVKRMREYDRIKRQLTKGEIGFEDSIASSIDGQRLAPLRTSSVLHAVHSSSLPPLSLGKQSSLLSLTHRGKLSSMVHSEDDYAFKWQRMREQRKQKRLLKEDLEEQRKTVLSFRSVAQQFERKAMQQQVDQLRETASAETLAVADKNKTKCKTAHSLFMQKQHKDREKKSANIRALKQTLEQNAQLSRSMKEQERELIAQHISTLRQMSAEAKQIPTQGSSFNTFTIPSVQSLYNDGSTTDASSERRTQGGVSSSSVNSFIVSVPVELNDKVKHARSLAEFETARKEVKDYQEQMYTEKLRAIAMQKHFAQKRAKNIGSPLRVNLLRASDLFSDESAPRVFHFDDSVSSDLDDTSSIRSSSQFSNKY